MASAYRPEEPVHFPPTNDEKNLRLLVIGHYVGGALVMLFSSLFLLYVAMGVAMLHAPAHAWPPPRTGAPPQVMPSSLGAVMIAFGSVLVFLGWAMGVLTIWVGRSIARRRRHMLCIVVDGLLCLWMPVGTVLGVLSLIMLTKPHIRMQFEAVRSPGGTAAAPG